MAGLLCGALCANGLGDIALGLLPLAAPDLKLPVSITTLFPSSEYLFAHRAVGYLVLLCGFTRFVAGYSRSEYAVLLAALSYGVEAFMFVTEAFVFQSVKFEGQVRLTTIGAAIMMVLLLSGALRPDSSKDAKKKKAGGPNVLILALLTIAAGGGQSVAGKRMGNALPEHMFFILLIAVFVLAVVFFAAAYTKSIRASSCKFPKRKFAYMAIGDTLQMFLQTLAMPHVPGKIQGLLSKTNIPMSMVFGALRGKSITVVQVCGGLMIVAGAIYGLLPQLLGDRAADSHNLDPFWCLLYFSSTIPAVLRMMYTEQALAEDDVEENYMNGWITLFQAGFTVLLLPVTLVIEEIPQEQLLPKLESGFACLVAGQNITAGADAGGSCGTGWRLVALWLLLLFAYNAFMTSLVKRAGASLMFAVTMLITPITNLAYSFPLIMGEHAEPINTQNLISLGITVFGILVYRIPASLWGKAKAKTD